MSTFALIYGIHLAFGLVQGWRHTLKNYIAANNFLLAIASLYFVAELIVNHLNKFSEGLLFEAYLMLDRLYGVWTFPYVLIYILAILIPILFLFPSWRIKLPFILVVAGLLVTFLLVEWTLIDENMVNYRGIWSFGWKTVILPKWSLGQHLFAFVVWTALIFGIQKWKLLPELKK
ncbi:MAG: hypothetical protein AAF242_08915 [Bacteroidota bacterium]